MPKWKVRWLLIRFSLFKRSGLRVHLSDEELIVIRPSLMEVRLGLVFSGEIFLPDLQQNFVQTRSRVCSTFAAMSDHGVCAVLAVSGSIKQHLLASYFAAFVRVCDAADRQRHTDARVSVVCLCSTI